MRNVIVAVGDGGYDDESMHFSTTTSSASALDVVSGFYAYDADDDAGELGLDAAWSSINSSAVDALRAAVAATVPRCVNVTTPASAAAAAGVSTAYVAFKLAVDVYLVGVLCVAGLLGNALSIAVLYRDRREDDKRNTTNWLLQVRMTSLMIGVTQVRTY